MAARMNLMLRSVRAGVLAASLLGAGAGAYEPPRTAEGRPDFHGVWTNASITTLERHERYDALVIPPEEVEAMTASHPQVVRQETDDGQSLDDGLLDGSDLARGRGYNAFWIDPGTRFGVVHGETRTSWIVDPNLGRDPSPAHAGSG